MAKKKKKQTRAKKVSAKVQALPAERSAFWPLSGAVVLGVVALFLLLGGFGTGGPLPRNLFHGAYWTIGWAAYFTPVALVYYAVYKFAREDHTIPLSNF